MSWYRDYKEQWKEIIETVAAEEHRTTQMVEKDTIQSMILSGISQGDLPFVFKGGTSLSKAYGLIDRFSEDIDLSMNRKPTEGEKKHIIFQICLRKLFQVDSMKRITITLQRNSYMRMCHIMMQLKKELH